MWLHLPATFSGSTTVSWQRHAATSSHTSNKQPTLPVQSETCKEAETARVKVAQPVHSYLIYRKLYARHPAMLSYQTKADRFLTMR